QQGYVVQQAAVDWQLLQLPRRISLRKLILRGLDKRLLSRYLNRARCALKHKFNIGCILRCETNHHIVNSTWRKSSRCYFYLIVFTRNKVSDAIEAFTISGCLLGLAGFCVSYLDRCACNVSFIRVLHDAL